MRNALRQNPFILLFFSLTSGILIYEYFSKYSKTITLTFIILALFVLVLHLILSRSKYAFRAQWLFGVFTILLFSVWGIVSSIMFEVKHQFDANFEKNTYEVEVLTSPIEKEKSYMCEIKLLNSFDSLSTMYPTKGYAVLYFQKDSLEPDFLIGDKLIIQAQFQQPDGVQNPGGFDYAKYLKRQGIAATAYIPTDNWIRSPNKPNISIKRFSDRSRAHLLGVYKKFGLEDDEFSVLAALTLGYKDELDEDIRKVFSASGAAHILAVSGLHVSTVYGAVFLIFSFLGKSRRMKIISTLLSVVLIWVYAFITGMSPAVIRASLMLSFVSVGTSLQRKSSIYNTIFISAFLILLVNPNLLFNISFQLSYAAVLSIIMIHKLLYPILSPTNKILKWLWGLITVSIAAQMGTAPISIYYFNQFPNYFLLTNIIAIPLASMIIYTSIALFVFSWLPYINTVIALTIKYLVKTLNLSLEQIVSLPGAFSAVYISNAQLWLLILTLLLILYYIYNKNKQALILGFSAIFLYLIVSIKQNYQIMNQDKMVVFADSKESIISFIHHKSNLLYATDEQKAEKICTPYWRMLKLKNHTDVRLSASYQDGFVSFKGKRILILDQPFYENKISKQKLELDYIIVSNGLKPKFEIILQLFEPKKVIIDKTISPWYTNQIKEKCVENDIECYLVSESGAYVVDL